MSLEPITAGIDLITSIVSRVWPDKTEEDKLKLEAALRADNNLTSLLTAQAAIDQSEAASDNVFVAGWRPAVGWVCASAFAWQFVVLPVLLFIGSAVGHQIQAPTFDISTMLTVLTGMLGLGTLRTYEKTIRNSKDS